mmetsp:Transcript_7716/g.11247  ORF Transcript_7716/g.11247 Transcript_7716/m.11247 type:complete len:129 (-) Transcript_7716:45-431(-)
MLKSCVALVCAAALAPTFGSSLASHSKVALAQKAEEGDDIAMQFYLGEHCTDNSTKDLLKSGNCCYDCYGFWAMRLTHNETDDSITRQLYGRMDFNCTGAVSEQKVFELGKCYSHFNPQGLYVTLSLE